MQVAEKLSSGLGVPVTQDLGCYLGHHFITKGRSNEGHAQLLQRVRDGLQGWKILCLSQVDRLTLAKSMLDGMSVFHMQLQRLPTKIHKELDKAVRQYIWGSSP